MKLPSICEVCGRPAKYHETLVAEGSATVRHLCGIHGRKDSVDAFKDILLPEIETLPAEWLAPDVPRLEVKRQIKEASTMKEIAQALRIERR